MAQGRRKVGGRNGVRGNRTQKGEAEQRGAKQHYVEQSRLEGPSGYNRELAEIHPGTRDPGVL